jgi:hypothetical protein
LTLPHKGWSLRVGRRRIGVALLRRFGRKVTAAFPNKNENTNGVALVFLHPDPDFSRKVGHESTPLREKSG